MATNKENHAIYSVCLKAFVENKKNGNRGVSLRYLEETFKKRADYILSWMQAKMYGSGPIFHGTSVGNGVGWYLRQDIYAMTTAEFQEYYKQYHSNK